MQTLCLRRAAPIVLSLGMLSSGTGCLDELGTKRAEGERSTATPADDDARPSRAGSSPRTPAATLEDEEPPPARDPVAQPVFDREGSQSAFARTLYPLLRERCAECHSGAPEGHDQLPLHADRDARRAHDEALSKVSLREPAASKLVRRVGEEGHGCWSQCAEDGQRVLAEVEAWASAVHDSLPVSELPLFEGKVSEDRVLAWIARDRAKLDPAEATYVRYVSLHRLANEGASPDQMNAARAGISKILNSTARYAPRIEHPVPIDPYFLVYRFDVRKYWGYRRRLGLRGGAAAQPDAARGQQIWSRVSEGNVRADGADAQKPNNAGFLPEYVEAAQLAYTLTRPDVYNEIMSLPVLGSMLEAELGVDPSKGLESYQYMTVNDAITINERLIWRAPIPTGYFWRTVDQFSFTKFVFYDKPMPEFMDARQSQMKTTALLEGSPLQAQAGEVIWTLPNGLQGYAIWGAGNELNRDAFTFVVVDPRRGGSLNRYAFRLGEGTSWRLLNGASCMSCHAEGLNRAQDDMRPYLARNRDRFDAPTLARLERLYPGSDVMKAQIEKDRAIFAEAMRAIREAMIVGTPDKSLYVEPVSYLFETAQRLYGYKNTQSN